MADIDHFKRVNDTYGHVEGDHVLREFAERVKRMLRQGDSVCRVGGEEFLLIASGSDEAGGMYIAERIREAIAKTPFQLSDGKTIPVTCSLGLCNVPAKSAEQEFDAQVRHADDALYQAKHNGRNRVSVYRQDADHVARHAAQEKTSPGLVRGYVERTSDCGPCKGNALDENGESVNNG
jgi:diguanylate cyclase (GGDEF)-like protein